MVKPCIKKLYCVLTRVFFCGSITSIMMALFISGTVAEELNSLPIEHDIPMRVYFGDTHVHTNLSTDAAVTGNMRLSSDEAYRLGRGEIV